MIPYFENCPHNETGWCLGCVSELGNKFMKLEKTVNKNISVKIGMIGACFPEDWEEEKIENAEDIIKIILKPYNNCELVKWSWNDVENILYLNYDEIKKEDKR